MGFFSKKEETPASTLPAEVTDKAEIGRTLLNKLEHAVADPQAPAPPHERQEALDASIQKKLHDELAKLRKQEKDVQKQIELALEKENLERESKSWFSKDKGQSSVLLQQELDRVKAQAEKYQRRDISSFPTLKAARESLVQCYKDNEGRTLDCWKEYDDFKKAIVSAERDLLASKK
ncbi:hypothetical protein Malapachy_1963 [Malassezia pachydermatis]|uniref:Duf1690 domain-containing protein n=1 Tax=Malassezia pachydermatis TaxID=77020 RepID=A0A0M9VP18_9BASI|nr:hypothetical protein Malapachy_1963 [Malassezia pachydermatis]KOS13755.1 hypothetical protein Malapachy_1963 [Malassezia pachydermatis]